MNWGREVLIFLKQSLFPIFCLDCGKEGSRLCEVCFLKQKNKIKEKGFIKIDFDFQENKRADGLDGLCALFNYKDEQILAEMLKNFKYQFAQDTLDYWKDILEILKINGMAMDYDLIIPVPLYFYRLRERGFNQSELIAKILAKIFNCEEKLYLKGLIRVSKTKQQARLNFEERLKNVRDVFKWQGEGIYGKKILLVDDVYTTGATLNSAAKVLKDIGANRVNAFVLAKD